MSMHQAVLLEEAISGLAIKKDGVYIDGTFGRGGHSHAILQQLSPMGKLFAFDKDPIAIDFAQKKFSEDKRFHISYASFASIAEFAKGADIYGAVDGILLDLGLSSPQLDDAARGFSFMQSGPLDMRMDVHQEENAASFINTASAAEMATVFKNYGEERFAKRIAQAIVQARTKAPIVTTQDLVEIVKLAQPRWDPHKHPATRVFQAIRIYVNKELQELATCLQAAMEVLTVGGRLVVISFHSLEDRIVKQFLQEHSQTSHLPSYLPLRQQDIVIKFKKIGKAIKASGQEIAANVRARSAVLRIGEKIA